jgi:hypothetical protein
MKKNNGHPAPTVSAFVLEPLFIQANLVVLLKENSDSNMYCFKTGK